MKKISSSDHFLLNKALSFRYSTIEKGGHYGYSKRSTEVLRTGVTPEEMSLIQEVVKTCAGISRTELAYTVCELLEWKRPGGGLKARECRDLLERLEDQGVLSLPCKKSAGSTQGRKSIAPTQDGQVYSELTGQVEDFMPITVEVVQSREQRDLFKELLSRYHYLGYAMPYGARVQYLCYAEYVNENETPMQKN